ncbi:MAG: hypothetical protein GYA17_22035 [Chloroflexi bacterium]|jgi:hypothetical protein|nr:YIP1 family protein [Anaerolineaceae bacterium]NMB91049.1 hypothetical protein [Chloroflexota bacterium]
MVENELEQNEVEAAPRRLRFEWLAPLWIRPRRVLEEIVHQDQPVWLAPMLVLTLTLLVAVVVTGAAQPSVSGLSGEVPSTFEYFTPEQQAQFQQAQSLQDGPLFRYVFPAAGGLIGLWLVWFLMGSILHLSLTLNGSRGSHLAAINLAAWASLPLALRFLVRTGAALATHQAVANPGLSGFIDSAAGGLDAFLRAFLSGIDLYFLWGIVLLWVGALPLSGLSRAKAALAVGVTALLVLALQALPGFISAQLSGLNTGGSFFFF